MTIRIQIILTLLHSIQWSVIIRRGIRN